MNWQKVEQILKDCTKEAGNAGEMLNVPQSDYLEFLARFNGAEGFIGPEQYLILWRSDQVEVLNAAYSTAKFLPGVMLIGTDGSDTGFGLDSHGRYVSLPLVGMSSGEVIDLGSSFEEFLDRLSSQ